VDDDRAHGFKVDKRAARGDAAAAAALEHDARVVDDAHALLFFFGFFYDLAFACVCALMMRRTHRSISQGPKQQ
jgi:hypothetical protein